MISLNSPEYLIESWQLIMGFFFLKEQYGIKKTQLFGNSFLNANIKKYLWVIIFNVIVTHSLCSYHLPSSHCSEEGMVTPIL